MPFSISGVWSQTWIRALPLNQGCAKFRLNTVDLTLFGSIHDPNSLYDIQPLIQKCMTDGFDVSTSNMTFYDPRVWFGVWSFSCFLLPFMWSWVQPVQRLAAWIFSSSLGFLVGGAPVDPLLHYRTVSAPWKSMWLAVIVAHPPNAHWCMM